MLRTFTSSFYLLIYLNLSLEISKVSGFILFTLSLTCNREVRLRKKVFLPHTPFPREKKNHELSNYFFHFALTRERVPRGTGHADFAAPAEPPAGTPGSQAHRQPSRFGAKSSARPLLPPAKCPPRLPLFSSASNRGLLGEVRTS